jgi:hypothetical protein
MSRDELVAAIRERTRLLYEGRQVAHRSCGIALAEAFGRDPRPYQALRRGGVTGDGECGAVVAGRLVLGELLGDPDPTGPVTPALREALTRYRDEVDRRLRRGPGGTFTCNDLLVPFPDFQGEPRQLHCTTLAAEVAEVAAGIALDLGAPLALGPAPRR